MANDVFANGREVACKAADGKSIAAFPDVCFTPPECPATPPGVPIPYPNTAFAKDTSGGSKKVKISGKEVMLKNKSYFKKSVGDEAGCAAKKGVITSKITGKVYFTAWSMDVKFEGQNVVRHFDLTTHNHGSDPANEAAPWPYVDSAAFGNVKACKREAQRAKKACAGQRVNKCSDKCKNCQKCLLVPKGEDKKRCCQPHTTGHHLIEDHWVKGAGGFGGYDYNKAPTVCANRFRKKGTIHRRLHDIQGILEESYKPGGCRCNSNKTNGGWNYKAGKKAALTAHEEVFKGSNCSRGCMEAQLDKYYKKELGANESTTLSTPKTQALGSRREALAKKYW